MWGGRHLYDWGVSVKTSRHGGHGWRGFGETENVLMWVSVPPSTLPPWHILVSVGCLLSPLILEWSFFLAFCAWMTSHHAPLLLVQSAAIAFDDHLCVQIISKYISSTKTWVLNSRPHFQLVTIFMLSSQRSVTLNGWNLNLSPSPLLPASSLPGFSPNCG